MLDVDASSRGIKALAEHINSREIPLPHTPDELAKTLLRELWAARDDDCLLTKKHECSQLVKLGGSPVEGMGYVGIYGGEKDFKRRGDKPRFIRHDRAWFHFTMTVAKRNRQPLALIAYDFELCFSEEQVQEQQFPRFVRFDLNPPGHDNEARELRSHMHPGHDDLTTPAPLMGPLEILHLFLYGKLVPPSKLRRMQSEPSHP